ncbi:acyltransferase family protein [Sphingomonas sp. KC8]|uniref:acyltransferase family protein n=2 Tax=Sphingomonas sp. KC8 TaxID=1030157 RepID=UPI0009FC3293|nr:acyltransferase [Sphingomonas sp. KC8]
MPDARNTVQRRMRSAEYVADIAPYFTQRPIIAVNSAPTSFNPYVHGARGLFSAMVFVYHVYHSGLPTLPIVRGSFLETIILDSMKFGVELFFGISGFVIVGALARTASMKAFLWDRIARIYPTLWASLLAITLMALVAGRPLPPMGDWIANFVTPPPFFDIPMVHPAAWSLGYEMTFYALCAAAWWMRGQGIRWWLWIAGAAGATLMILFPRSILMAAGVMIAAGLARPLWMDRLARYPLPMLLLFLLAWRMIDMAAGGRIRLMSPLHADFGQWIMLLPAILISGIIGGIALLGIERGHGAIGRTLRSPAMQWLGTISYSFYLWHPICMAVVKFGLTRGGFIDHLGMWSQAVFFILSLPVALILSHWSQIWLENHATRWLRGLAAPRRAAAIAPAPAGADTLRDCP